MAATVEMKVLMDEVAAVEQQLRSPLGRGDLADLVAGMQAAEKEKLRMTVSLQAGGICAQAGLPVAPDVWWRGQGSVGKWYPEYCCWNVTA